MSKEKMIAILEGAFDKGVPFIDYTPNYIYCLIPTDDEDKWLEVSYDIPSKEFDERSLTSEKAYVMLCEEVEKGISMEITDFMVAKFKEFKESIKDKSHSEKIVGIIDELVTHTTNYSQNLPIITKKESLDLVKGKV
ncbi:MAG: hypothetical protein EU530_01900 [Promethearchaeota archaeon]|nr:MAG: hypothetical protein EU530_01900 [Candidatus Lokiarchaeota archaeon]